MIGVGTCGTVQEAINSLGMPVNIRVECLNFNTPTVISSAAHGCEPEQARWIIT